jgi:DNA-binding SARP family transcriptional activator
MTTSYLQSLTTFNADTFTSRTESYPLILTAPRLRSRNALLAWLVDTRAEMLYYALTPDDSTLPYFLANMTSALRDIDPKFGAQLQSAVESLAEPQDLADALAADLSKARPKPHYLVLDNFDHLTINEEMYAFFLRLTEKLPRGMQLVLNSRSLTYAPWAGLLREGRAVMLGDDRTLNGGIFDTAKPESAHLEVFALAGGSVFVNGLPLTTWDGPLPRNLFYYFVDHHMVTRDEIFETFWPDLPTKEATNVFHVTKRKISERLGYELTAYSGGFYRPSGQMAVHYDAGIFETIVEDSRNDLPDDPAVYHAAIQLYRVPFLHKIEMPWIVRRRETLRLNYAEALIGAGRLHRKRGESERAISLYLRALREVPQREDIHRDLMSMYSERREYGKALEQYNMLSNMLERSLNITPSKVTQALYRDIAEKARVTA